MRQFLRFYRSLIADAATEFQGAWEKWAFRMTTLFGLVGSVWPTETAAVTNLSLPRWSLPVALLLMWLGRILWVNYRHQHDLTERLGLLTAEADQEGRLVAVLNALAELRAEAIDSLLNRRVLLAEEAERLAVEHLNWRERVLAVLRANFQRSFYAKFEHLGLMQGIVAHQAINEQHSHTLLMLGRQLGIIGEWLDPVVSSPSALALSLVPTSEQAGLLAPPQTSAGAD